MKLKFLGSDIDRHGKQRWYVRAGERPRRKIRLPVGPGSPGFLQGYEAAVEALKNGNSNFGRTGGFVYFLLYGNGNGAKVKIGTSKNVNGRLAVLKTGRAWEGTCLLRDAGKHRP